MLKLDILVPAILIICLIALAYILHEIFNEPETVKPEQTEIILDPSRYTDDTAPTNGSGANISNTPDALDNDGSAVTDDAQLGNAAETTETNQFADGTEEDAGGYESPAYTPTVQTPETTTPTTTPATTDYVSEQERDTPTGSTTTKAYRHKYIVIAGSYRQEANARQQLTRLRKAGFQDAELGFTNRGAYAVAVAGKSDSEMDAREIATKVRAQGFAAFVKQRK